MLTGRCGVFNIIFNVRHSSYNEATFTALPTVNQGADNDLTIRLHVLDLTIRPHVLDLTIRPHILDLTIRPHV